MTNTTKINCLTCGYNLRGLPSPRCPECGRPFDPGRDPDAPPARSYLRRALIGVGMVLFGPISVVAILLVDLAWAMTPSVLSALLRFLSLAAICAMGIGAIICIAVLVDSMKAQKQYVWLPDEKAHLNWAIFLTGFPVFLIADIAILLGLIVVPGVVLGIVLVVGVIFGAQRLKR